MKILKLMVIGLMLSLLICPSSWASLNETSAQTCPQYDFLLQYHSVDYVFVGMLLEVQKLTVRSATDNESLTFKIEEPLKGKFKHDEVVKGIANRSAYHFNPSQQYFVYLREKDQISFVPQCPQTRLLTDSTMDVQEVVELTGSNSTLKISALTGQSIISPHERLIAELKSFSSKGVE